MQHKRNIVDGLYRGEGTTKRPDLDVQDLHNSQFCTDISSWGDIEWTGKTIEKCNTTFVKKPAVRWEKVIFLCTCKVTLLVLFNGI